ncbi:MAG TPA: hypothetical protein VFM36_15010 [Thermoanaerobaculia bacterium]|nr:hypothetical protein [Thermoanaerobaculia bacterium]
MREERKRLRDEHGQLLTLLNEWDPAGIVGAGEGRDRYSPLADALLDVLGDGASEKEITELLEREIAGQFGRKPADASRFATKVMTWSRMASGE